MSKDSRRKQWQITLAPIRSYPTFARDGLLIIRINRPEVANAPQRRNFQGHGKHHEQRRDSTLPSVRSSSPAPARSSAPAKTSPSFPRAASARPLPSTASAARPRACAPSPSLAPSTAPLPAAAWESPCLCDMVVAAENAKFGCTEVGLGIIASTGGLVRLARDINRKDCMELLLTGKEDQGSRGQKELGLINYVVPAEEVLDKAIELAEEVPEERSFGSQMDQVHRSCRRPDVRGRCNALLRRRFTASWKRPPTASKAPQPSSRKRAPQWQGK